MFPRCVKSAMATDDKQRIGQANNVKNKTSQYNFIFSSGYRPPFSPFMDVVAN